MLGPSCPPSGATLEHQRKPRLPATRYLPLRGSAARRAFAGRRAVHDAGLRKAHPDHGRAGPDDGRILHPRRNGTDQQLHGGRPRGDLHRDVRRRHIRRILRRRPAAALGFHRCPVRLPDGAHALGEVFRGPEGPCRHRGAIDRAPGVQDQEDVGARLRSERPRRARAGAARAPAPGNRRHGFPQRRRHPAGADPL